MLGRASVTTCHQTSKLLLGVSVEGMLFLIVHHDTRSDFGIGTPPLVQSLCQNRLQTEFGIRTVSGSTATLTWCVLITFH
jgi:hypothetical protein